MSPSVVELAEVRRQLCSLEAVRERCAAMLALARAGGLSHFALDEARRPAVLEAITKASLELSRLPASIFGRLRHFDAGGVARTSGLAERLRAFDRLERARSYVDLVLPSVLLDAGAGSVWSYVDVDGTKHTRSEGLAIASLRLFEEIGRAHV